MTTHTIEITAVGESVSIEVEELGPIGQLKWVGRAPDSLMEFTTDDPDSDVTTLPNDPEIIQYLVDFTTENTILTAELLDELELEVLIRVISEVFAYGFGGEPVEQDEDAPTSVSDMSIELNDDGTVDLDEWE